MIYKVKENTKKVEKSGELTIETYKIEPADDEAKAKYKLELEAAKAAKVEE